MHESIILSLVQAWKINGKAKYRGFRCGNCQRPLYKAWHHWCTEGGYLTPVHLCNNCELLFKTSRIKIINPSIFPNKMKVGIELPNHLKDKLKEIIKSWNVNGEPIYKTFTCDNCGRKIHKAYHFWVKMDNTLTEFHFCKKCGDELQFLK
jgi:RNase P subunit RPR2